MTDADQGSEVPVGMLVGPGVLPHVAALHDVARRIGVAVVNTWGAKGVFAWDSPFHGGTAGLQARDFELAGLGDVDLLVTSGLDPAEVTSRPWAGRAEVVDVAPSDLARFAATWDRPPVRPTRPRLYTDLAAVIGPMYDDPATPAAKIRALSLRLVADGTVFAAPGPVGFWVARTWPTTVPGSVVVPARAGGGGAERLARDAAASGRRAVLVTGAPASVEGVEVVVLDGDLTVPPELLAVAGPVVAWT